MTRYTLTNELISEELHLMRAYVMDFNSQTDAENEAENRAYEFFEQYRNYFYTWDDIAAQLFPNVLRDERTNDEDDVIDEAWENYLNQHVIWSVQKYTE